MCASCFYACEMTTSQPASLVARGPCVQTAERPDALQRRPDHVNGVKVTLPNYVSQESLLGFLPEDR